MSLALLEIKLKLTLLLEMSKCDMFVFLHVLRPEIPHALLCFKMSLRPKLVPWITNLICSSLFFFQR